MIILCLLIGILVLGIILAKIFEYGSFDWLYTLGTGMAIIGAIGLFIAVGVLVAMHINPEGDYQKYLQRRESLVYQLENKTFLNDNNVGTNELFLQIAEYNEDLIYAKEGRKNPFINIYFPPYVDKLELITYDNLGED